jgi:hypothetical protein
MVIPVLANDVNGRWVTPNAAGSANTREAVSCEENRTQAAPIARSARPS